MEIKEDIAIECDPFDIREDDHDMIENIIKISDKVIKSLEAK